MAEDIAAQSSASPTLAPGAQRRSGLVPLDPIEAARLLDEQIAARHRRRLRLARFAGFAVGVLATLVGLFLVAAVSFAAFPPFQSHPAVLQFFGGVLEEHITTCPRPDCRKVHLGAPHFCDRCGMSLDRTRP